MSREMPSLHARGYHERPSAGTASPCRRRHACAEATHRVTSRGRSASWRGSGASTSAASCSRCASRSNCCRCAFATSAVSIGCIMMGCPFPFPLVPCQSRLLRTGTASSLCFQFAWTRATFPGARRAAAHAIRHAIAACTLRVLCVYSACALRVLSYRRKRSVSCAASSCLSRPSRSVLAGRDRRHV